MATTDFIAAIELSSSKISGIAGKKSSDGSIQVLAYAREDASPFIHKGAIYNIDKAAQALTSIINKLEGQLNNSIAKVYVGIGGQSLRTVRNAVSRTLEEESIISQELVDEICDENRDVPLVDMSVLDVAPQEYKIDNTLHVEPVGVAGTIARGAGDGLCRIVPVIGSERAHAQQRHGHDDEQQNSQDLASGIHLEIPPIKKCHEQSILFMTLETPGQ